MEISILSILVCAVAAMVLGMLWHSKALFGGAYMKAIGADINMPPEKMVQIQKKMWQLYLTQFVVVFIQAWVLAHYIAGAFSFLAPLANTFWLWVGFVFPTLAGQWMWSARPRKLAWKGFLISMGYNLILLVVFCVILTAWMV